MKKKALISVIAIALVAILMSIPSVQAVAMSALSVFRVGTPKTIKVTVADIEEVMNYFEQYKGQFDHEYIEESDIRGAIYNERPEIKTLSDVSEFDGFNFKLPTALANETPTLYATDSESNTVSVDTAKINEALSKLGSEDLIDERYDGSEITVNASPSIAAKYADVILFASQGANIDGNDDLIDSLWSSMLNMPFISENLRSQLSKVNIKSGDVYLPAIMGLGRETSVGNATGYIYSMQDFDQVISSFSKGLMEGYEENIDKEGSALLWIKDGILYCLVSEKSDGELTQIARSIP